MSAVGLTPINSIRTESVDTFDIAVIMTTENFGKIIGDANANPTKAFFVRMLTRDISIEDCILDLIDNSVDAAWESEGGPQPGLKPSNRLSPYTINLSISPESFEIADNCGGLSLEEAKRSAFNFGNIDLFEQEESSLSVGVYGIGMKRAIFKLGSDISVTSTFKPIEGNTEAFTVRVNVDEWLSGSNGGWHFPIHSATPTSEAGLKINVRNLNEEVRSAFTPKAFANRLYNTVAKDYMLSLAHGLNVTVNNMRVEGEPMTLLASEDFAPFNETFVEGGVTVKIIAGMADRPSDGTESETRNTGHSDTGWNIFCNGRAVLTNDTTSVSGWGKSGTPRWHPQYTGFKGYVFFTSNNPALLPMTTTKRSVDEGAKIYKQALGVMSKPVRDWIDYTNRRKSRQEAAQAKEESAKPANISDLKPSKSIKLPDLGQKPIQMANISFTKPASDVKRLGETFGDADMAYRDVGLKAFDLAYTQRVDEEEYE